MLTLKLSKSQTRSTNGLSRLALLVISVAVPGVICYGQNNAGEGPAPPHVELLRLDGSKPNLASNGEGIISYKTTDLFQRGITKVRPFDLDLKIELPTGYTLFNNLAYVVESKAVFSGPNDVVFSIPSATEKELFERLRILHAEYDQAEPAKPRWVDNTVTRESDIPRFVSKAEYEKLLPDFNQHTLHTFTEEDPALILVALKDSKLARDKFSADLSVSATATPQTVMEGRAIKQVFVVTNNGPDTATAISFSSQVDPEFVALSQSQGICRWDAHNLYCNLGTLPKGASATITYDGKSGWDFFRDGKPTRSGGEDAISLIRAAELDPDFENNQLNLYVPIIEDPNKGPIVDIVSPTQDQFFVGPQASIKIVTQALDPDGAIGKLELYDGGKPIGAGELRAKDQYEFTYENVSYGHHALIAVATDDKGRPKVSQHVNVHVNGQARIQFMSPTANQVMNGPVNGLDVTVRVNDPSKAIEKVVIHLGLHLGGIPRTASAGPGRDQYSTTFKEISGGTTHTLYAVVTDDAGVQTLSEPISFRITEPPLARLHYFDGEYSREIVDGTVFNATAPIEVTAKVSHVYESDKTSIVKVEFYADGQPICADVNNERKKSSFYNYRDFKCTWKAKSGEHVLSVVATDSDGVVGKSQPVAIVVR